MLLLCTKLDTDTRMFTAGKHYEARPANDRGTLVEVTDDLGHTRVILTGDLRFPIMGARGDNASAHFESLAPVDAAALPEEFAKHLAGFVQVTGGSFHAVVGLMDVHPYPYGRHDQTWGYRSDWKRPNGERVGVTIGGTTFSARAYFVPRAFFETHRASLQRIGEV